MIYLHSQSVSQLGLKISCFANTSANNKRKTW